MLVVIGCESSKSDYDSKNHVWHPQPRFTTVTRTLEVNPTSQTPLTEEVVGEMLAEAAKKMGVTKSEVGIISFTTRY